jgi:hypothetical protein
MEKAPVRPKLASSNSNSNSTSMANSRANGSVTSRNSTPKLAPPEEKKRGRGLSIRRFFSSSSNKAPKERMPRSAMTYGDLA